MTSIYPGLNDLGVPKKAPDRPVPTLPKLALPDPDEHEIEEAARTVAERRAIRAGLDAWHLTQKSATFENWKLIGSALRIGRDVAVRATGVKTGKHYARAFYDWADRHGFDGMTKEARWSAVDLAENIAAVQSWRATLPERQRKRLIQPLSVLRRWRRSLTPKAETDAVAKAKAALRHFLACMNALPPAQTAPLWQDVQATARAKLEILQ